MEPLFVDWQYTGWESLPGAKTVNEGGDLRVFAHLRLQVGDPVLIGLQALLLFLRQPLQRLHLRSTQWHFNVLSITSGNASYWIHSCSCKQTCMLVVT